MALRRHGSIFSKASRMLRMPPVASVCMRLAISTASMPRASNTSRWREVTLSPRVSALTKFFIPVAAISGPAPEASSVALSAAISCAARPAVLATTPWRLMTRRMSASLVASVLPKRLTVSPSAIAPSWLRPRFWRQRASEVPASSAEMPNATDILVAASANSSSCRRFSASGRFSSTTPMRPAAATISITPSAVPRSPPEVTRAVISRWSCAMPVSPSKSTTLAISAIRASAWIAGSVSA